MSRAIFYYLAATDDQDRGRGFEAGYARHDALPDASIERPSQLARSRAGLARLIRRDRHSLTSYPCRLPDGKIGRTAIVLVEGEWTAVCAVS